MPLPTAAGGYLENLDRVFYEEKVLSFIFDFGIWKQSSAFGLSHSNPLDSHSLKMSPHTSFAFSFDRLQSSLATKKTLALNVLPL